MGPSLGSSEWRKAQSAPAINLDSCKTYLQDSRRGRNLQADTKEASRAERRLQLLMKTSRQLRLKPSFQATASRLITYEQVRSEIQTYIEARRSQFAFKTVAAKNSSDPMDVHSFCEGGKKVGKKGKHGKGFALFLCFFLVGVGGGVCVLTRVPTLET